MDPRFYKLKNKFEKGLPPHVKKQLNLLLKHKKSLDYLTVYTSLVVFFLLLLFSPTFYHNVFSIIFFIILQGLVIHNLVQLFHEYAVHANIMPIFVKWIICFISPFPPSIYKKEHLQHHCFFPNSSQDPDLHINIPLSKVQKVLFFTFIGEFFKEKNKAYFPVQIQGRSKTSQCVIFLEKSCFYLLILVTILLSASGNYLLVLGWLIPLLFGVPLFTGLRAIVEHSKTRDNDFLGTSPEIEVPLFFKYQPFVSVYGKGHIIHHCYPAMPWYNIPKACTLLEKNFQANEKINLYNVIADWFSHDYELEKYMKTKLGSVENRKNNLE